jgi:RNA polymerase sigma-70 factor (ECF subfamily)
MEISVPTTSDLASPVSSRMDAPTEESWLAAARQGDVRALEQFYNAYRQPVYTLCLRLLGRTEDAEDAMQATFAQAFRHLAGFRGECTARTWLYRIAVNEATSILRRRKRATVPLDEQTAAPDSSNAVMRSVAVHSALARVSPAHRAILVLRYWEDLAYEEMAEVLRISLAAAKMRLNRAKAEFRRYYGDDL